MDKNQKNKTPLHKRTHWRNLRDAITDIAVYEKVNPAFYDFTNGVCYTCSGDELKGSNVTFTTSDTRSIWVGDNDYEMYEFPKKSNSSHGDSSFLGDFVFLSHDTDYDYWVFGTMRASQSNYDFSHSLNYTANTTQYTVNPLGTYTILYGKGENIIKKECNGYDSMYGELAGRYKIFDSFGARKKAYTGKAKSGNTGKKPIAESSNEVKVYKKKKRSAKK